MSKILTQLFQAADQHGEDDDPGHTVGDLQDLLRSAWLIMDVEQKQQLLNSPEVQLLVDTGARDEFEVADLVNELTCEVERMHVDIQEGGYTLYQDNTDPQGYRYYWDSNTGIRSKLFSDRAEAINDAFRALQTQTTV